MSDLGCLTCGAPIIDAVAGACHACGAEDRHIGSQRLWMPAGQRPLAAPAAEPVPLTLDALRPALAEWDAIEGSGLADQFRAFIAAGKMADAIRAALASPDKGEPRP